MSGVVIAASITPSIRSLAGLGSQMQASLETASARSTSHSRDSLVQIQVVRGVQATHVPL
jgi:hypothetical protein